MDSSKDSASVKDSSIIDDKRDKSSNHRSIGAPPRQLENSLTANPSSGFTHFNAPRDNSRNSITRTEPVSQSTRHYENTSEPNKCSSSTTQSAMCNSKVTKSNVQIDHAVAGSSRSSTNTYDNCSEPSHDLPSCQRHKKCIDKTGSSSNNIPSTSSSSRTTDNPESNTCKVNRKRPSSLKLNRIDDDSSSDTGNDDYSLGSEDGCIYTYRGGEHLADLPSSFFSLDMGLPLDRHLPLPNYPVAQQGAVAGREQVSRASSPDMEFLEMDFDPGPSCEVDSGDESSPDVDLDVAGNLVDEIEPALIRGTSPEYVPVVVPRYNPVNDVPSVPVVPSLSHGDSNERADICSYSVPSTSRSAVTEHGDTSTASPSYSFGPYITHVNTRGEQLLVRRTMAHAPVSVPVSLHISSGNLVSPREILNFEEEHAEKPHTYQFNQGSSVDTTNLSSALYHTNMARKLIAEKAKAEAEAQVVGKASDTRPSSAAGTSTSSVGCVEPPRCMIWSEGEACDRQVTQVATSACGATAVVNVFNALGVPVNLDRITSSVGTRQRANNAPLPRYLLSRAVAGCTAADLVSGIHRSSDGLVTARFFPTYPERAVSLSHWLADWITLGAVPILTLNLQAGCEGDIPDAWHHQMVFGVSPRGIYLCNPVECVREGVLWPHLTSPSVLLVRTRDVLARFTANTDLTPLMAVPDRRFHTFNVLGQVVNVIREWRAIGWGEYGTRTRHIRIPAAYQAGITVAALTGSEAHRRLVSAPPLPVLTIPTDQ